MSADECRTSKHFCLGFLTRRELPHTSYPPSRKPWFGLSCLSSFAWKKDVTLVLKIHNGTNITNPLTWDINQQTGYFDTVDGHLIHTFCVCLFIHGRRNPPYRDTEHKLDSYPDLPGVWAYRWFTDDGLRTSGPIDGTHPPGPTINFEVSDKTATSWGYRVYNQPCDVSGSTTEVDISLRCLRPSSTSCCSTESLTWSTLQWVFFTFMMCRFYCKKCIAIKYIVLNQVLGFSRGQIHRAG